MNYLPYLDLNCDPPILSRLSSEHYRCEPLAPGWPQTIDPPPSFLSAEFTGMSQLQSYL
jgi:hypothetical protein